jgi:arylsulfatase A-like enzyme
LHNVLWIVIDAMRWDRVGFNGYHRPTSPNLDRLAQSSVRFDQMISPHIPTHPAHTTLFSGLDVFDHQIIAQGGYKRPPAGIRYLPEILREHGYFTAAVDNIKLWVEPTFERYVPTDRWDHDGSRPWRNGEDVTRKGLQVLEEANSRNQPFFVFLHYWDPHTPYLPPAPFDRMFYSGDERNPANHSMERVWNSPWFRRYFEEWMPGITDIEFVKAQYDASIAYSDHCVGIVLDELRNSALWDNTIVILHADHGEELDDHGMWFDHHGLYDTNVRVPFLLRIPGSERAVHSVSRMTSLLNVRPTVLDLLDIPIADSGFSGRTLLSSTCSEESVYLTECTWMRKRGWRTEKWKLIEALEPDIYGGPNVELYDLDTDPAEQCNLAAENPEAVHTLSQDCRRHIEMRLRDTGNPDPLVEQAAALRTWQPRFITGKS